MADTKITGLPEASVLDPTDLLTIVTGIGGTPQNEKITYSVLKTDVVALANAQFVTGKSFDGLTTFNLVGVSASDSVQVGNSSAPTDYFSGANHSFYVTGVNMGGFYSGGLNVANGGVLRATSPNSSYHVSLSHNNTDAVLSTSFGKLYIPETINVNGADLTNTLIGQWNTAYGWGDHAGLYAAVAHTHELASLDATGATDGHVLTADGAGGAAWEAPPAGGGGVSADSYEYTWSTTTLTSPGPASGIIRFNNANYDNASTMQFSETDANGNLLQTVLSALLYHSTGFSPVCLHFRIVAKNDPSRWATVTTRVNNDFGTYWNFTIEVRDFNGAFVDAETVIVKFAPPYIEPPNKDSSLLVARASNSLSSGAKPFYGWMENRRIRAAFTDAGIYLYDGTNDDNMSGGIKAQYIGANNRELYVYQSDAFSATSGGRMYLSLAAADSVLEIQHRNGGSRRFQFESDNLQIGWSGSGFTTDGGVIYIKQIGASPKGNKSNCGQVWVNDNIDLMYTDSTGNTSNLSNPGATGGSWTTGWTTGTGGSITIAANAPLYYNEQSADDAPGDGQGQVWVRNDTPNTLVFTNDALTDFDLSANQLLANYRVKSNSLAPTGTTETLTYSDGPAFELDLESVTDNPTVTLAGAPTSGTYGEFIVKVNQDSAVARTITWAGGTFRWEGGSAHAVTTTLDGWTIFRFETWDGGTTYYARGSDFS